MQGSMTAARLAEFFGFTKEAKDGDGDGLIYDGTPEEQAAPEPTAKPKPKRKPKTTEPTPMDIADHDFYVRASTTHAKKLQKRRLAALSATDDLKDQAWEITNQQEHMRKELDDVQKQIDQSIAQGQAINQMTEKLGRKKGKFAEILEAGDKKLADRKTALLAKMTDLENQKIRIKGGMNDTFREALGITPSPDDPKVSTKYAKTEIRPAILEGTAIVKNWTSSEILKNVDTSCVSITSLRADAQSKLGDTTRSFVYNKGKGMALADAVTATVVAHEFGHVIEYQNPHIHKLAKGFLAVRVGGEEPTKLADKYEGYGQTEYGRKDNFETVFDEHSSYYIGKHYRDATEVISMGLEQLHRDPVKFAENDPEYFDLMIGALQGVLK